jgi:hypothetical protein
MIIFACRDCIGDCSLAGDPRWAGTFGVNLDFVARCHCSVEFISVEDMQVCQRDIMEYFSNSSDFLRFKCFIMLYSRVY